MTAERPADVLLMVVNASEREVALVLEPRGEVYPMAPGQRRDVVYHGDRRPRLTIDYGEAEIKIWEEGPGELDVLEPDAT